MSNRPLHVSGPGMTTSEAMQMAECTGCGSHGSKTKTKILRKHRTYCFLDYSTDDQNHVKIMRLCHRARQLANWRQRTREVDYQALNDTEASNMLNEFMATVQNRTDEWHTQVGLVVAGIDERQAVIQDIRSVVKDSIDKRSKSKVTRRTSRAKKTSLSPIESKHQPSTSQHSSHSRLNASENEGQGYDSYRGHSAPPSPGDSFEDFSTWPNEEDLSDSNNSDNEDNNHGQNRNRVSNKSNYDDYPTVEHEQDRGPLDFSMFDYERLREYFESNCATKRDYQITHVAANFSFLANAIRREISAFANPVDYSGSLSCGDINCMIDLLESIKEPMKVAEAELIQGNDIPIETVRTESASTHISVADALAQLPDTRARLLYLADGPASESEE